MSPRTPQADAETFARACDGDMEAHARLYELFAPMVYTLARRMLAAAAPAEDVLQETFVEVIRHVRTCRGHTELGFWIRRIAVNKCLMHLRSGWVRRQTALSGTEPAASSGADEGEDIALERALGQLSATARAVVLLHDVEGYTHNEIAALTGRTASFSKSQLARAHERLRELLSPELSTDESMEHESEPCLSVLKTC